MKRGPLLWNVYRRYSEFVVLHHNLESLAICLPILPPKHLLALSKESLVQRKNALNMYIQGWFLVYLLLDVDLIAIPDIWTLFPVMEFFGLVKNHDLVKDSRMMITQALRLIEAGDIILFRTNTILSALQRQVTNCRYDHVAIVVCFPFNSSKSDSLHLLEATGDGVHTYSLKRRLTAWSSYAEEIALRRLKISRSFDIIKRLVRFADRVDGFKYNLNPVDIFRRTSVDEDQRNSFFCSELVAAAFKAIGVLPSDIPSSGYFPCMIFFILCNVGSIVLFW